MYIHLTEGLLLLLQLSNAARAAADGDQREKRGRGPQKREAAAPSPRRQRPVVCRGPLGALRGRLGHPEGPGHLKEHAPTAVVLFRHPCCSGGPPSLGGPHCKGPSCLVQPAKQQTHQKSILMERPGRAKDPPTLRGDPGGPLLRDLAKLGGPLPLT